MKESYLISYQNKNIGEIKGFIDEKGKPWFYASKICDCLKLKNSRDTIARIRDKHNKYGDKIDGVGIRYIVAKDSRGRNNRYTVVNENILYELIFHSETKKAFEFQQWVFNEVLPALRKHGEYRMEGKLIRRSLTDTIKTEIAEKTENLNEKEFCYANFSKLINKSLGLPDKVDRNTLDDETLEKIARRENLVQSMLVEGRSYNQIRDFIFSL
jgi:prophage antirepressor-like protein